MTILYVGMDLAKNVFAVYRPALVRPAVARGKLHELIAAWPCSVALEPRRGYCKAVVAIAAKNAWLAWAVLGRGERPA